METHTPADAVVEELYFWGKNQSNGFLSQWYTVNFTAPAHSASQNQEPMTFSSAEQYMMYYKAMAFQDFQIATEIMELANPEQQKAKGRHVKGFDEELWAEIREKIVEEANWWKFTAARNERERQSLRTSLLNTGDKQLIEVT